MEAKRIIVCDTEKCVGCEICEYMCSIFKEKTINWSKSRIRHVRIEPTFDIAIACRKCEDPLCIKACPRDAVAELEDGSVRIEKDKCNGCGWCIEACNFGALKLDWDRKCVFTCDFCADLDQPKCVEFCPYDALEFTTLDQVGHEAGKRAFKRIIEEMG